MELQLEVPSWEDAPSCLPARSSAPPQSLPAAGRGFSKAAAAAAAPSPWSALDAVRPPGQAAALLATRFSATPSGAPAAHAARKSGKDAKKRQGKERRPDRAAAADGSAGSAAAAAPARQDADGASGASSRKRKQAAADAASAAAPMDAAEHPPRHATAATAAASAASGGEVHLSKKQRRELARARAREHPLRSVPTPAAVPSASAATPRHMQEDEESRPSPASAKSHPNAAKKRPATADSPSVAVDAPAPSPLPDSLAAGKAGRKRKNKKKNKRPTSPTSAVSSPGKRRRELGSETQAAGVGDTASSSSLTLASASGGKPLRSPGPHLAPGAAVAARLSAQRAVGQGEGGGEAGGEAGAARAGGSKKARRRKLRTPEAEALSRLTLHDDGEEDGDDEADESEWEASKRRAVAAAASAAGSSSASASPAPVRATLPIQQLQRMRVDSAAPAAKKPHSKSAAQRLQGARFRMLNEMLYTTTGNAALSLFKSNPSLFEVYHQGFKTQVERWPVNPVDRMIEYILGQSPSLVVADFGCGEAQIASSVPNKVHSFDLVACNDNVVACDIAHVPLDAKTCDIAIFSLSLMGSNFVDYLCEAHRVLRMHGTLKIAEVRSRLRDFEGFIRVVEEIGFEFNSQDLTNVMFVEFEFTKSRRKTKRLSPEETSFLLQPCLYKRR